MGMIMDLWRTLSQEEKRKVIERRTLLGRVGLSPSIEEIITDVKRETTLHAPIQLELPLKWSRHVTPEHSSKVLELCTNLMLYR